MITLTASPQGQITIPLDIRKTLNIKAGTKLILSLTGIEKLISITLTPHPKSWVDAISGSGKNIFGNADEYLKKERASWDKKYD